MARAGQETTLRECDANIAIYYRIVKNRQLEHGHHMDLMNKSLDRRLVLMQASKLMGESNREDVH